jgi:hypothetical protein
MTQEMKWHAAAWDMPKDIRRWEIAGGGFTWAEQFLDEETSKIEYGPLFVYMFRRFGVSEWGSDPYKDIACWYLTTPDPHVVLWVKPCVLGAKYSFGYGVAGDTYDNGRDDAQVAAVNQALRAAVRDLLVPTNVRDTCINAAGRVADEDVTDSVPYFPLAGIGVGHDYLRKVDEE